MAATLLAACGGDDDDGQASRTTTTTAATTTTLSPEEEVKAAYLAFAEMGKRLLQAPNPDDPELAQRASGEALGNLKDGLTTLHAAGEHYELGPNYSQDLLRVNVKADQATAEVCVVDDARRVDASGTVVAEGTTTVKWTVVIVRTQGHWLVGSINEGNVKEGTHKCE